MYRVVIPCLAMTAAILSIDASAQSLPQVEYLARAGSQAPFSPAVRAGDFIYLSGQLGLGRDGKVPATIAEETRAAMDNLQAALNLAGAGFDDVVKCTIMLADMKKWDDFNAVYRTYFKPGRLPARSAMGVNGLAFGATLEVECVAYKPRSGK